MQMLAISLLLIASVAGTLVSVLYLRKNLVRISQKNETEPKAYKRVLNYPLTVIWYGYLIIFFIGLSVNNLIFT
jgi:bacteriorhodopsin